LSGWNQAHGNGIASLLEQRNKWGNPNNVLTYLKKAGAKGAGFLCTTAGQFFCLSEVWIKENNIYAP
jgi:hypothetical protein